MQNLLPQTLLPQTKKCSESGPRFKHLIPPVSFLATRAQGSVFFTFTPERSPTVRTTGFADCRFRRLEIRENDPLSGSSHIFHKNIYFVRKQKLSCFTRPPACKLCDRVHLWKVIWLPGQIWFRVLIAMLVTFGVVFLLSHKNSSNNVVCLGLMFMQKKSLYRRPGSHNIIYSVTNGVFFTCSGYLFHFFACIVSD